MSEEIVWSCALGSHLEAARRRAGLRRIDLAYQLGVSEETIRLWEKGSVQPSVERLARLIALMSLETADWPARTSPPTTSRPSPTPPSRARGPRRHAGRDRAGPRRTAGHLRRMGDRAHDTGHGPVRAAGRVPRDRRAGRRHPVLHAVRGRHHRLASASGSSSGLVARNCGSPVPRSRTRSVCRRARSWPGSSATGARDRRSCRGRRRAVGRRRFAGQRAAPPGSASTLGELILARQRELGLRSADVAQLIGTTEATVSRWVNGRSRPGAAEPAAPSGCLEGPLRQRRRSRGSGGMNRAGAQTWRARARHEARNERSSATYGATRDEVAIRTGAAARDVGVCTETTAPSWSSSPSSCHLCSC